MDRKIIQLELVRRIRFWEEEIAEWQTKIPDLDIDTDDIANDIRTGVSAERLDTAKWPNATNAVFWHFTGPCRTIWPVRAKAQILTR